MSTRPEFANRRRTAIIDGATDEGWFASDFTLAEIKTLRAIPPFAERPQQFNGRFEIPTFEEVIALAKRKAREKGRTIGVDPETKHPTYHTSIGLPLERRLLAVLRAAGWDRRDAPVFIQSFGIDGVFSDFTDRGGGASPVPARARSRLRRVLHGGIQHRARLSLRNSQP